MRGIVRELGICGWGMGSGEWRRLGGGFRVAFGVGFGGGEWAGDASGGEVLPTGAEPTDQ